MSYALAASLQEAVFQRLSGDAPLASLVGDAIYDRLPTGPMPDTYVTLGPEDVWDRSDKSGHGAWHRLTVSVITEGGGFHAAKKVAAAISDALVDAELALARGRLTGLHFFRAQAKRAGTGDLRRIDLTFRARVDDSF